MTRRLIRPTFPAAAQGETPTPRQEPDEAEQPRQPRADFRLEPQRDDFRPEPQRDDFRRGGGGHRPPHHSQGRHQGRRPDHHEPPKRFFGRPAIDVTFAESFYYIKQMKTRTPLDIALLDGEVLHGIIEWYDRDAIKISREGAPNLVVLKRNIKYLSKSEVGEALPDRNADAPRPSDEEAESLRMVGGSERRRSSRTPGAHGGVGKPQEASDSSAGRRHENKDEGADED